MGLSKRNTIKLLVSLKTEKDSLTKSRALGFAAKSLELIKKSVGQESEQYRLMSNLFYDQTGLHLQRELCPSDEYIVFRVKMEGYFDSIIDTCIEFVNAYGVYKPPTEKKNILGDLDNSMIWTFVSLLVFGAFSFGIIFNNWQLNKYLESNGKPDGAPKAIQTQKPIDTLRVVSEKKIRSSLKQPVK